MEIKLDVLIPVFDDTDLQNEYVEEVSEDVTPDDVEVEEDEVVEDEDSEDEVPESNEAATLFYKELAANGIGKDDKDDYTFEDVNSLINDYTSTLPEKITNEIIGSTPEIGQKLIDYVFTKGESLSKEDLASFVNTYLEDVSSTDISVDNESDARTFLSDVYKKQGFKEKAL